MNPMIYISSSASSKDKIKDAVLELVQLGFFNIELSGGTKYYQGIEKDLLNLKQSYKINFLIHNYFPPTAENFVMNIASKDEYLKNSSFKLINSALRLSKILGSNLYTFHAGFNSSAVCEKNGVFYTDPNSKELKGTQNTKKDFYQAVDFLLKNIVGKDIKIGIENFFPFHPSFYSFLDSGEDIIEFLDRYSEKPNIGLLLDLGHLNVAANHLRFDKFDIINRIFGNYSNKLFAIHISENDGEYDLHKLSHSNSWQIELLRQNKKALDNLPITFEWRNSCDQRSFQHFEALRSLLES